MFQVNKPQFRFSKPEPDYSRLIFRTCCMIAVVEDYCRQTRDLHAKKMAEAKLKEEERAAKRKAASQKRKGGATEAKATL